jgi:hypothetical protein
VNAGATRPADTWLDGLADGGRLILPLTTDQGFSANEPAAMARRGAIFRITRQGDTFHARWISRSRSSAAKVPRDAASEAALAAAFAERRLGARHPALPRRRRARGALLAACARVVLGVRVTPRASKAPEPVAGPHRPRDAGVCSR